MKKAPGSAFFRRERLLKSAQSTLWNRVLNLRPSLFEVEFLVTGAPFVMASPAPCLNGSLILEFPHSGCNGFCLVLHDDDALVCRPRQVAGFTLDPLLEI